MCEEFENEKKKEGKKFNLPEQGFEPRFSVIFPPEIWIFMESEEPEIKSKQVSKRDRTLLVATYPEKACSYPLNLYQIF